MTHQTVDSSVNFWFSCRFGLAFITFLGFVGLYALRVNISVAIVCMVNHTAVQMLHDPRLHGHSNISRRVATTTCGIGTNQSKAENLEYGEFVWSKDTQGVILSSFFWGYILTQLPGGLLARRFGGKRVFGWSMAIGALATILNPVAARVHYALLIFLRFIVGLTGGVVFPCMHEMWSKWAPPLERSILVGISYAGTQLGNVLALGISGVLCARVGWDAIFYVLGGFVLWWSVVWLFFVSETPGACKRISKVESSHIIKSLEGHVDQLTEQELRKLPWREIAKSMPVWAIVVIHTSATFAVYLMLTSLPTFMKEVLHFDIKTNGLYSAIPYLTFYVGANIASFFADFLRKRGYLSTGNVRKLVTVISNAGQGIFFVAAAYCQCGQEQLAVALIAIGQFLSGFTFAGFLVNHVDIAPRYAGTLFGISNTFATLSGIVVPYVVSELTPNGTREEWQHVFWIAFAILIIGAIFYCVFGQGEIQPWALQQPETKSPPRIELQQSLPPIDGDTALSWR